VGVKVGEPKNMRAILFDLDGTLVNLPINYARMRKRLKELFLKYNIKSGFKPLIPSLENCLLKLKRRDISNKEMERVRKLAYNITDDEELSAVKSSRLISGSREILMFAKKRKIKIVIFTRNGSKCVSAVFKKYRLPKPELIASRDKVKKLKPNKEHLNFVLNKFNVSSDECLIIGNSFHDVEIGRKHNIRTIVIR